MSYEFEKRWWAILIFPSFITSIALVLVYFLIKSAERHPETETDVVVLSAIILVPALMLSAILFFILLPQMLTTFDTVGITRNYLLWKKQILWESIEEAVLTEHNPYSRMIHFRLIGEKRQFEINPFFYRDSDKLFALFDEQMRRYKN